MTSDIETWAERFIATPSVSSTGDDRKMVREAAALLDQFGFSSRIDEVLLEGVPRANLIADIGSGAAEEGVLLVTHLDTVGPGDPTEWTATGGDPFRPTRDGDLLYGLGAADAKVDFVAKVFGLAALGPSPLRRRVRIAGTFGEEIGLLGARHLVRAGRTEGFRYALVGEPSELACVRAHKGLLVGTAAVDLPPAPGEPPADAIDLAGHAAHSSTPRLGANAIESALDRIAAEPVRAVSSIEGGDDRNRVPARCRVDRGGTTRYGAGPLVDFLAAWRRLGRGLAASSDPDFDPPTATSSLNLVATQADASIARVRFTFDLRLLPGQDPGPLLAPLAAAARVEVLHHDPSLGTPVDSTLVRTVLAAQRRGGLPESIATKPTCTEAGVLAEAGLEAVVLGAGRSTGNVHRPNESTRISQLLRARDLYAEILRDLAA